MCVCQIEISDGGDVSDDFLMDELHPKKTIVRSKFLKPKGPARRPKSPNKPPSSNVSPTSASPPSNNSPVNGED